MAFCILSELYQKQNRGLTFQAPPLYILSRLFLKEFARALASSGVGAQAAVDSLSRQLRFVHYSNNDGGDGDGQHIGDDDGNGAQTLFGTS